MPPTKMLAAAIALAGCSKDVPHHPDIYVPPTCQDRFVGQVIAEAAAVDATDDAIYWLDYNFGTLQRRPRGDGPIETIVDWSEEHLAESMRVAGGYAYWGSKELRGLYRVALAGGKPERIVDIENLPTQIEVVGDIVYAMTLVGELVWWRSASEHGVLTVSENGAVISAAPEALYIGNERGIARLASPGAGPQEVIETDAPVEVLAVGGDSLYWKERERLMRRVRGEVTQITASTSYTVLAAAPGGLLIGESNVVSFAADDQDGAVPVAITPAEITDLEVRGPSVFVGTMMGSVHEVCVDPSAPVALREPAACDGVSCEWYDSGDLAARDDERFYADGTRSHVYAEDVSQTYFVDGTEATGDPWAAPAVDSPP